MEIFCGRKLSSKLAALVYMYVIKDKSLLTRVCGKIGENFLHYLCIYGTCKGLYGPTHTYTYVAPTSAITTCDSRNFERQDGLQKSNDTLGTVTEETVAQLTMTQTEGSYLSHIDHSHFPQHSTHCSCQVDVDYKLLLTAPSPCMYNIAHGYT